MPLYNFLGDETPDFGPGLATNSIIFFTIKDLCKKVRFQQTHNRGLRQLGPPRLAPETTDGVLVSL